MTTPPPPAEQLLRCDLRILLLDPRAKLPAYQSDLAAGLDIAAFLPDSPDGVVITPIAQGGSIIIVRTGWSMAIPPGFEAQIRPRSGLASKHAITLPNSPGTIDADYRGEVKVPLINLGREPYTLLHGARIAQMIIAPVAHARVRVVEQLDDTARGSGGFGSTGIVSG
jgi:dUTP pyrophosphatase